MASLAKWLSVCCVSCVLVGCDSWFESRCCHLKALKIRYFPENSKK